ncbi:hypothetical protein QBC37DRAFT_4189 [Rhypophila decipiens]|uniref:Uncharacterized protein n=1 Tax=Rhypophila decipiens TaxID=261697 RepID=A0AAN6YJ39_9PEZI|nr:hypothetical protein QBC37DRAFT_4189 [Rhypophila decipiens]
MRSKKEPRSIESAFSSSGTPSKALTSVKKTTKMNELGVEPCRQNFFCFSIRNRAKWATAVTQILQSARNKWQERNLGSHDIELSLSLPSTSDVRFFRIILLSPEESLDGQIMFRIDELLKLKNGRNSAIICLLGENHKDAGLGYQLFMKLQMRVLSSKAMTSVIPLASPALLPATLETFQTSLMTGHARQHQLPRPVDSARDLLAYCTFTPATPLSQETTQALKENSVSFRDLVDQLRTEEGQERIQRTADDRRGANRSGVSDGEKVVSFWACEYAAL